MNKKITATLSSLALAAGAVALGAVPAQAADTCKSGSVCYVHDGSLRAEVAPGVNPRVQFDKIINNSSKSIQVSWGGWGESNMFEGYIEAKAAVTVVGARSTIELPQYTDATGIEWVRVVR